MDDIDKINYFHLCSNEILKKIAKISKNRNIFDLSVNYNNYFENTPKVDDMWSLISTSLLMSENLFGTDNIYQILDDNLFEKIEEVIKLGLSADWRECYDNYFLDNNNNRVNEFHHLIDFHMEEYFDDEEAYNDYKQFGCNSSVIDNDCLDYKKLIVRIRNAIAHSNYEVIDNNFLRVYHYENDSNEMDLNIILNKTIILTIIDELNQRAFELLDDITSEYENKFDKLHFESRLVSDSEIIEYLLSFNAFDKDKCIEFLNEAKKDEKFYELSSWENDRELLYDNLDRFDIIYELICGKYMMVRDYATALDALIYDKLNSDSSITGYLWDRIGDYDYFNNNFYETPKKLEKNKLKLLLVAFFNSIILYGFNSNNDGKDIDYSVIDFSKMIIDDKFKEELIQERYIEIESSFDKLSNKERKLVELSESINKNKKLLNDNNHRQIEYFTTILPNVILEQETTYLKDYQDYINMKNTLSNEMYKRLFEISDLNARVNLNGDISKFIFRHLRNSLAHGYVNIPDCIDLNKFDETIICFEDYEKNDKTKLTFRVTIKLLDLIKILTEKNVIREILGIGNNDEKRKSL